MQEELKNNKIDWKAVVVYWALIPAILSRFLYQFWYIIERHIIHHVGVIKNVFICLTPAGDVECSFFHWFLISFDWFLVPIVFIIGLILGVIYYKNLNGNVNNS